MKWLSILLIPLALASCSSSSPIEEQSSSDEMKVTEKVPEAPKKEMWAWSYEGEKGPENWGKLNVQYDMCQSGQSQSPVNLVWQKPAGKSPVKISYQEGNAVVTNTGYTFRLEMTPQSSINFNGQDYLLEKIEMRTPSEHQLSGKSLPMELQFYHRSSNGLRQAVISLFIMGGKSGAWFDDLWKTAIVTPPYKSSAQFRFDPGKLIPPRQTFYHYQGSLPHPPCLEGVEWFVFNTPLQLSKEQITTFRSAYKNNRRPIQPLNGRKVMNH